MEPRNDFILLDLTWFAKSILMMLAIVFSSVTLITQFCPVGESIESGTAHALQVAFLGPKMHSNPIFDSS